MSVGTRTRVASEALWTKDSKEERMWEICSTEGSDIVAVGRSGGR